VNVLKTRPHLSQQDLRRSSLMIGGLLTLAVTGCMVGPKYQRPAAPAPPAFKEDAGWTPAQPADTLVRGKWWQVYNDPELNTLEEKINVSNENLKAAFEAYQSAHAQVSIQRADLFPTLGLNPSAAREQESLHRPLYSPLSTSSLYNDFQITGSASWEPDLWGRVRHLVQASRDNAQASAADLETISLSLHAELANDYFELRGLDRQKELLDSTVVAFQKSVDLTRSRFTGGLASASDLALAQTQLDTTRALDIDVGVARAQFEHAIATLTGEPASTFSLPPAPLTGTPPTIPVGLPSQLLQRRPDIAAAERQVAAANEQIGVARSAYYPTITLFGAGGVESTNLGTLIQGPSTLWAIGASASETLFDAGRRRAQNQQAQAAYDQTVALYRQQVLQSFQDVEDNLAALRILEHESKAEQDAVTDAERSLKLSTIRYKGGLATYLEVITTQSTALADEQTFANIQTRRMSASVQLIKAIGGTWDTSQLPRD
jgi:NodT family efflux transporter outer membrane factor (OMF) lipoprotein